MVAVRVSRIHARSPAPTLRISHLRAVAAVVDPAPPIITANVRITRLRARAAPPLTGLVARAGADRSAQGFAVVTLDGTSSAGATALTWSQTGGPAVTLSGTGGVRTFVTPTTAVGAVLTFQLTATGSLGTSVDTVEITALPWLHWRWVGSGLVPERAFFFGGTAPTL